MIVFQRLPKNLLFSIWKEGGQNYRRAPKFVEHFFLFSFYYASRIVSIFIRNNQFVKKIFIRDSGGIEKAFVFGIKTANIRYDVPAVVAQAAIVIKSSFCIKSNTHYTATLYSLSASFRDVFRFVEGFRLPMIKAQATWKSPAGKDLV